MCQGWEPLRTAASQLKKPLSETGQLLEGVEEKSVPLVRGDWFDLQANQCFSFLSGPPNIFLLAASLVSSDTHALQLLTNAFFPIYTHKPILNWTKLNVFGYVKIVLALLDSIDSNLLCSHWFILLHCAVSNMERLEPDRKIAFEPTLFSVNDGSF